MRPTVCAFRFAARRVGNASRHIEPERQRVHPFQQLTLLRAKRRIFRRQPALFFFTCAVRMEAQ
jgi:hypothetical protein